MTLLKDLISRRQKSDNGGTKAQVTERYMYKNVVDFCVKQTEANRSITAIIPVDISRTMVIHTDISFYNGNSFSFVLTEITDRAIQIKLGELSAVRNENNIFISDVQMSFWCKGYGTILIQHFIRFCKDNHIPKLCGWLSTVDLADHKQLLLHFWEKQGFAIVECNGNFTIELILDESLLNKTEIDIIIDNHTLAEIKDIFAKSGKNDSEAIEYIAKQYIEQERHPNIKLHDQYIQSTKQDED